MRMKRRGRPTGVWRGLLLLFLACGGGTARGGGVASDRSFATDPARAEQLVSEGERLLTVGKSRAALERFNRAVRLDPTLARAWFQRGYVGEVQGLQATEVVQSYRRAWELDPALLEAGNNLGRFLHEQGRPAEAKPVLMRVTRARGDYGDAYYNLGLVLSALGEHGAAARALGRAVQLFPEERMVEVNHLLALIGANQPARALEGARALSAKGGHTAESLYGLGRVFKRLRALDLALGHLDRAVALAPQPTPAPLMTDRAIVLMALSRWDEAVQGLREVVQQKPDYGPGHFALATAFEKQGQVDRARTHYRRVVQVDPRLAPLAQGRLRALGQGAAKKP